MYLSNEQKNFILSCDAKALGTYGDEINVVPVSSIFIREENIVLCDYFMNKTAKNILDNPNVSISCWSGISGIQIKGEASYHESGFLFQEIQEEIKTMHPNRILKGIIIISPQIIYDTSLNPALI